MNTETAVKPATVGKAIERVDGRLKVTGAARYAADAPVEPVLHAVLVQSTIARGRIRSLDTGAAAAEPGVRLVMTRENAPRIAMPKADFMGGGVYGEKRLPLSDDVIHHVGQNVAVVVADTFEQARRAAALVRVEYDAEEPVRFGAVESPQTEAPSEHFGEPLQYSRGNVAAAVKAARADGVVVEATYTTPVETHNPMEPAAVVAAWEGDKLTIHDATQWVMGVQAVLADAFGLPRGNVRIISPFVGGGFGCKAFIWPHQLLGAMAAKAVGKPVKLTLSRRQMFTSIGHRPPTVQKMIVAAKKDGALTALRHDTLGHAAFVADYVEPAGLTTTRLVYRCPNVETPHRVTRVNVAPPTFMRAPGETPGLFALESAMDELAVALKIDPLALRLKNLPEVCPHNDKPWSSFHLKECYEIGAEKFGWGKRAPEPRAMRDAGQLVGFGMATATFPGFKFLASAKVRLLADGRAIACSATHDLGTGAYTVFTQVTADALGLPIERVSFELGDSNFPRAPVAGGSNSTATVSDAILAAGAELKKKLVRMAAKDEKSPLFGLKSEALSAGEGRVFETANPSRGEGYADLVKRSGKAAIEAEGSSMPGMEQMKYAFQSFGAHFCEVRVDEALGRVRVVRHLAVMDVGRVINPRTSRSQVLGAVVMGIGQALMEQTVYDERTLRPVSDNFADYAIPVCADVREIEAIFIDKPDPHLNALGCRGVGEIGISGVAGAIANAVYHATGRRIRDLPITPDKLL